LDFWPDKFEVIFFIVAIAMTIPLLIFFKKLKEQLQGDKSKSKLS